MVKDLGDLFNLKGVSGLSVRFLFTSEGMMRADLNEPKGVFELKRNGHSFETAPKRYAAAKFRLAPWNYASP